MNNKKIIKFLLFLISFVFLYNFNAEIHSGNNKINDGDSSAYGCSGPVIIYKNQEILSYSVIFRGASCLAGIKTISKKDSIFCFSEEANAGFGFILKDTIITENDVYDLPQKMLVISDIHGNFKGFRMILTGSGVTDENLNWKFGNGHLVIIGDVFDRGKDVTECLWLIYKLENEALNAGGKVHFLLGNHELMNLKGNYKYVIHKYFLVSDSMKLDYKNWYDTDSELGKWLRSKNTAEKIGTFLFVHGGISNEFSRSGYSVSDINKEVRNRIDRTYESGEITKDVFIGKDGPLWYRGIVNLKETQGEIEQTLDSYKSSKIISGHTIVDTIKYLYNRDAVAVNVDHQINSDSGKMFALWFENNDFYIIDNNGLKTILK